MALFIYEYRKKTNIGLSKYAHWLDGFFDNPFNTLQEIREFTGKICTMRNGMYAINHLYKWQDTIPPFLVCFKLYEEGKLLEKSFILKQHKGEILSEADETQLFSFLSNYPNIHLTICLAGVIQIRGF